MNCFKLLFTDYKKYKKYGGNIFSILLFTQGFWAITQYRFAHQVYLMKIPVIKQLLQLLTMIWQKIIEILCGISIPASVVIGDSFYIGHFGGIILNSKTIIGSNCNIAQGVTIGVSGLNEKRGVPVIGNNVYIAANATVAGKIVISENVLIGANTLVIENVSANSIMLGVPAQKISDKGSEGYI